MTAPSERPTDLLPPYGLLAEFETAPQLIDAANKAREAGYKRLDAYTPYPIEALTDALGHRH
ncbi:MAG: DUF3341 domain-containing protein, partial [Gemmataceae bacterium]|nr:DUF3341 domain-containing protein [Gemmataceae bacterium]